MKKYEIIEQFCEGKTDPARNEDRLVVTPDFIAVIDGATSSAPMAGGRAGGIVAAEAVEAALLDLNPVASLTEFAQKATAAVREATGVWEDKTKNRPCATAVVYSVQRAEVWRIGDSHIRLDDKVLDGEILAGRIPYTYRSAIIRARLALGLTTREAEQQRPVQDQPFWPFVEVQNVFVNHPTDPMGFGAINGVDIPEKFLEVYDAHAVNQIVLCSDGFFTPAATLQEGLAELDRLRLEDPLLCEQVNGSRPFPVGSRFFDDTTYVRILLSHLGA